VAALVLAAAGGLAAEQVLVLKDGRRIPVTRLERRDGMVIFTIPSGQQYTIDEEFVLEPAVSPPAAPEQAAAPQVPGPEVPPPPATEGPRSSAEWTGAPSPWAGSVLFQSAVLAGRWDSGFPGAVPRARSAHGPLRGGAPILGRDVFLSLSGVFHAGAELRARPVASGISPAQPDSAEYFGSGHEVFALPRAAVSAHLWKAGGPSRPRGWALKATGVYAAHWLNARENAAVGPDPRGGTSRQRQRVGLEEAYGEVEILPLGAGGFVSLRAGLQPFLSDPQGHVFADTNLGARLFGLLPDGRVRFDLAWFDLLEKDTDTALTTFRDRGQWVAAASVSFPDVFVPGNTVSVSLLRSEDHASREPHYDRRGRLVRPARVGTVRLHNVDVNYFGLVGHGRWGPVDVTHATYAAFGADRHNPIAARHKEIVASFFAVQAQLPRGRARYRLGTLISSGEDEVTEKRAAGFDGVVDGSDFAGGAFSYWSRTGIALPQTGILLKGPASLIPNLRSSRVEGQANFVNPGLILVNTGADLQVTPRLAALVNANYLWFHNTDSLEEVLFQSSIDTSIGLDLGVGAIYRRPEQGLALAAGVTGLLPTIGFDDVFRSFCHVAGCGHGRKKLYNAFLELRLAY
jgi:hypothetical protein